jgi:hypothetical protein
LFRPFYYLNIPNNLKILYNFENDNLNVAVYLFLYSKSMLMPINLLDDQNCATFSGFCITYKNVR